MNSRDRDSIRLTLAAAYLQAGKPLDPCWLELLDQFMVEYMQGVTKPEPGDLHPDMKEVFRRMDAEPGEPTMTNKSFIPKKFPEVKGATGTALLRE